MSYAVKEIFYTLQGEGALAGTPAVFCRFAGCNLWSGREEDRQTAVCNFCDTDFVGTDGTLGGKYSAAELAGKIAKLWPSQDQYRFVVCTGGEPLLQLDQALVDALHQVHFKIAVETNGTQDAPNNIDWICVSPKANQSLRLQSGNELKLVYPQENVNPKDYENLSFQHFSLSPMDGPNREANTQKAIDYCLQNPRWKLSLQTHKMVGIR